ncbi:FIG070318: hypothetical protein [hydrothermal vent metagenome]|uniref:BioF2-like acetyltransferase domain-containing protein n=1 Tax=hydrothermal vent metagenome TaxID=652676 RepID=A0A3B1A3L7_9ZZZZ
MNLQIYSAKVTDKARWNQYVHTHPQATAYHNFSWAQSVEQAYGHPNVSQIALIDDKIIGVLPVIKMTTPLSGHFYCSLPFCDIGHALADNEQIITALLDKLHSMKNSSRAKKIEYRDTCVRVESVTAPDEPQGKKVRMLLPLPETSAELLKSFKSKLRSQIHKSEKNGLTYQIGNSTELLDAFYQIFIHNMRKLGSPVHSKDWYRALRENYQNDFIISIVYTEKTAIGAGIVLRNNSKACIPWASTLAEYNRLAPNMLLYWSLLKEMTDSGAKEFDFGRSTFGEGTFKFKQQWGAQPLPLHWFLPGQGQLPSKQSTNSSKLRKIVEQTWPKLPIGITTLIGPRIRKYISL